MDTRNETAPEPVPAQPLSYFSQGSDAWLAILKLISWTAIAYALLNLLVDSLNFVLWLTQKFGYTNISFSRGFWPMIVIQTVINLAMLCSAIGTLRLHSTARLLLIIFSSASIILQITGTFLSIFVFVDFYRNVKRMEIAFDLCNYLAGNGIYSICPILVIILLTRRSIRDLFSAHAAR